MGAKTTLVVGAAGVAAGLVARSLIRKKPASDGDGRHPQGWKSVTILGDSATFVASEYPEPLGRIAEVLDVRVEPAPGERGFEVHARVRDDADVQAVIGDADPDQAVRVALRDAKQLFETGEILRATPRPHGRRPRTLLGNAVDKAEDEAKGEGVL